MSPRPTEVPSTELTRKRKFIQRVNTGCITCRIRRVKCDEGKPTCHRCTSTGRKCDGYDFSSRHNGPNSDAVLGLLPGSIEEQRSIHFFSTYSAQQLGGLVDTTFWTEAILQAVHANPAIRHAVSAVSVLHAKFLTSNQPVVSSHVFDGDLKFALQQCNQSIDCLTKQSADDPETTLTACILFISFASMQGYQLQALNHLRGGLRLLDEIDSSASETKRNAAHPVQLATLRTMFASFNAQARCMLSTEMLADWTHEATVKPKAFPVSIHNVETVQYLADELYYSSLEFIQKLDASLPSMEEIPTIIAKHNCLMQRLASIKDLLADFLVRQALRLAEKQRISVWRTSIYLHLTEMFLCLAKPPSKLEPSLLHSSGPPEQAWDDFEPQYTAIVELAWKILTSRVGTDFSNQPSFSISMGVVMPLFLVASRCRHPRLRREAIQLLMENPRREGIWDSNLAGKIAARGMEIEEEEGFRLQAQLDVKMESAWIIPESCRISHFEIIYRNDRKAEVVYWTTAQRLNSSSGLIFVLEW